MKATLQCTPAGVKKRIDFCGIDAVSNCDDAQSSCGLSDCISAGETVELRYLFPDCGTCLTEVGTILYAMVTDPDGDVQRRNAAIDPIDNCGMLVDHKFCLRGRHTVRFFSELNGSVIGGRKLTFWVH